MGRSAPRGFGETGRDAWGRGLSSLSSNTVGGLLRACRQGCLSRCRRTHWVNPVVGGVCPPGGDFSEPITQNTLRIAGAFWSLDTSLAYRRHFPAVNWITSYSLYIDSVQDWFVESIAHD